MASTRRQSAKETPHSKRRRTRMALFRDGNAVRKSTHSTRRRWRWHIRDWINAIRTMHASIHPDPGRNPNCSSPASQVFRSFWSTIWPSQLAMELMSRMPRRLVGSSAGLPGLRSARRSDVPHGAGYTRCLKMMWKTSGNTFDRHGRSRMASEGMPSSPADFPGFTRFLARSISSAVGVSVSGPSN